MLYSLGRLKEGWHQNILMKKDENGKAQLWQSLESNL